MHVESACTDPAAPLAIKLLLPATPIVDKGVAAKTFAIVSCDSWDLILQVTARSRSSAPPEDLRSWQGGILFPQLQVISSVSEDQAEKAYLRQTGPLCAVAWPASQQPSSSSNTGPAHAPGRRPPAEHFGARVMKVLFKARVGAADLWYAFAGRRRCVLLAREKAGTWTYLVRRIPCSARAQGQIQQEAWLCRQHKRRQAIGCFFSK